MNDFEEWIRSECFQEPPPHSLELARAAWNVQAKRIAELEARESVVAFKAYCEGYGKGHNDTVEARYGDPEGWPEDWPEIYADILEGLDLSPQEGE